MVRKNDIIDLTIEDLGVNGEGIGKVDGYTLFVKDGVIGDEVTVKVMKANKNFGFARLMEINKPSKDRVTPRCSVARQCGGCQIQCLSYEEQLKFKQNKVYNNLVRIGGQDDFVMKDIIGMEEPFNYRNKAQFPVGIDKEGNIVSGFYAGRTHSIIGIDSCDLGLKLDGRDINKEVMDIVKKFMTKYQIEPYNEETCRLVRPLVFPKIRGRIGQQFLDPLHHIIHIELRCGRNRNNLGLRKQFLPFFYQLDQLFLVGKVNLVNEQ